MCPVLCGWQIPGLVVLVELESRLSKPWGQASKQHSSIASASAPTPRFGARVPSLDSHHDGVMEGVNQTNLVFPKLLSVMVFISAMESKLRQMGSIWIRGGKQE